MRNIVAIGLALSILLSISTFPNLAFSLQMSIGNTYTNEAERARKGIPIRSLQVDEVFQCTIECNILHGCESFNFITSDVGLESSFCKFFNKSIFLNQDKGEIVESSNSTYYEKIFRLKDCADIRHGSFDNKGSGIYPLEIFTDQTTKAFCDMATDDGGWTLLQRRFDGKVDFNRDWASYKHGFGDLNGEFWLGLENAHLLMKDTNTTLRFDLWDDASHRYQEYYHAIIEAENDNYRLSYDGTSGTAGDPLSECRGDSDQFSFTLLVEY